MNQRRSRSAPALSFVVESLESRVVLSTVGTAGTIVQGTVEVASQTTKHAATQTALTVNGGTLGQPITFNVTVKAAASAGSPSGTVKLIQKGVVIQSLTLTPSTTTGKSATSQATYTLTQPPGGSALFFGKYPVTAQFIPGNGGFAKSTINKTITVTQPAYTSLANGVKVATIASGSGAAIQTGQTASVLYTGYLAKNGQIFDDSLNDGGPAFNFTVGAGQVIPGFDAGTLGMQVGETRIVEIPAAQAYGSETTGSIPPNSTLIFVLTLEGISTPATTTTATTSS